MPHQASDRLRFGLIGCGSFSRNFSRYLLEAADIVALCDLDEQNISALIEKRGLRKVRRFTDYRAMIDGGGLDAVAITAANHVHREIAVAAAEAGLHVYCDKAMARTVPECWDMVRACERNRVKLMVGHKRRLRPPWARMIELTNDHLLGKPYAISVTQYVDNRPYEFFDTWWGDPARSGGFLHMHGVHVIDWMRAMCGDAAKVSAFYGPQHDPRYRFPDVFHVTIQFKSGALAGLNGSLSYPIHKFRESQGPRVECEQGGFKLDPFLDHLELFWQRLEEEEPQLERFDDLGFDHAFRLEVGDFVRWVTEDRPPCLTWVEGLRCVEIMEAAYRSGEREGEVVGLPLYPELE
jgi:predicted dehydrogenase